MEEEIRKQELNELEVCQKKSDEYLNGWKRERADFLNYKKDEMERIGTLIKYANEEIILKLLPILDNIYLAESHVPEEFKTHAWIEGFNQIKTQLCDFLQKEGIKPIEVVGRPFDPNFHEIVEEIGPSEALAKEGKPGKVVEEVQRGYTLNGKLIRVAKVKISK